MTNALGSIAASPGFEGLLPEALLGLTSQYPKAHEFLVSQLKTSGPFNRTTFLSAKDMSIAEAFFTFNGTQISDYFKGFNKFINAPIIQHLLKTEGQMGCHGVPQMPLFIYKAIADELTPVGDTDELVNKYCAEGANILYERNTVGGHLAEELNGDKRAIEWLSKVLQGKYGHVGCTIKDVTIDITDSPL